MKGLLNAVNYMHDQHVIHRDIKPGRKINIKINKKNNKLLIIK